MRNLKPVLAALLLFLSITLNAQVPVYNSYPGAAATVFLDFDGQMVTGTTWNSSGPIACAPANISNDQIEEIFNRVSEDFRPFNLNITTDSSKYWSAPSDQRIRVILTTTHEWYSPGYGGVAIRNSFSRGDNTPCFVFTAALAYNIKKIAEAAAHEAGHTLGLRHQSSYDANCVRTSEYHYGAGSGETSWAPIMGVGYSRNFTVWHDGPNPLGCTNLQNDLAVITGSTNGFGYRPDDHSGNFSGSTPANFVNNQFVISGVVAQTSDADLFRFSMPSNGRFRLDAVPYNVGSGNNGSDLDMHIELINGSQAVIGVYNPGNELSSVVDTMLSAGTYYIRVDGKGNQYATEYGSLGSFSLQAEFTPPALLPLRKLELNGHVQSGTHRLSWLIDADEAVLEQQLEAAPDGINFQVIAQPATAQRNFQQVPNVNGTTHYRLKVLFDNGNTHYSNTLPLRSHPAQKPSLLYNKIHGSSVFVQSPAVCSYVIADMNGRTVVQGNIGSGNSEIRLAVAPGAYVIRFVDRDQQWTEKFLMY
jgi:hypothetical protein